MLACRNIFHDDGGLARLSEGEDGPDFVLAGTPHVLRLDADAAALAFEDRILFVPAEERSFTVTDQT